MPRWASLPYVFLSLFVNLGLTYVAQYDYVGLEAELLPKEQHHDGAVGGSREPRHGLHEHESSPASGSEHGEKP